MIPKNQNPVVPGRRDLNALSVISERCGHTTRCPLYPRKRTLVGGFACTLSANSGHVRQTTSYSLMFAHGCSETDRYCREDDRYVTTPLSQLFVSPMEAGI
jgi:hypothetical protein